MTIANWPTYKWKDNLGPSLVGAATNLQRQNLKLTVFRSNHGCVPIHSITLGLACQDPINSTHKYMLLTGV